MSTQHPDNVATPIFSRDSLMSADDQMHAIEEQLQALKPWRPSGEQKTVKKA